MRRALLVLVSLILCLFAQPTTSAPTPVALSLEGPLAMTPGQIAIFFVNVSGGPAELNGTFTIKYWAEGSEIAGASPLEGSPGEQSGKNNTYQVNITAPTREGSFDVVVEAISANEETNSTVKRRLTVEVLSPLILTAVFRNDGGATVLNVTVRFFVDDRSAGSKVISRINPGEKGTVTLNWIPVGLGSGQHSVRAEADLNGDGIIDSTRGEAIGYDIFYRTGAELAPGWLLVIGILIVLGGLLLILSYRRRKRMR